MSWPPLNLFPVRGLFPEGLPTDAYSVMIKPAFLTGGDRGPQDLLLLCGRCCSTEPEARPWWATWTVDGATGLDDYGRDIPARIRELTRVHEADRHAHP